MGKGGGEEMDGSVQLQEEGRHPLPSQFEIFYLVFNNRKKFKIVFIFLFLFRLHVGFVKKISLKLLLTTTFSFFVMKNTFIIDILVRGNMLSVFKTDNILIIQPERKT